MTEDMEWSAMNKEEVQDKYNFTDKCDGRTVEILNNYWHADSGKLWIKTDKILYLDDDRFDADTFRVDRTGCLDLYILKSTICMARAQDNRTFRRAR